MKKETLNGILKKTIHEALDYIGLPEDPEIVKLKMKGRKYAKDKLQGADLETVKKAYETVEQKVMKEKDEKVAAFLWGSFDYIQNLLKKMDVTNSPKKPREDLF